MAYKSGLLTKLKYPDIHTYQNHYLPAGTHP